MSESRAKKLRNRLHNPQILFDENAEAIERYRNANPLGRWLMRRTTPEAAMYYDFLQAEESIGEAIKAAALDPHNDIPLHSAV